MRTLAAQALMVLEQALDASTPKVGVLVKAVRDLDLLDLGNASEVDCYGPASSLAKLTRALAVR